MTHTKRAGLRSLSPGRVSRPSTVPMETSSFSNVARGSALNKAGPPNSVSQGSSRKRIHSQGIRCVPPRPAASVSARGWNYTCTRNPATGCFYRVQTPAFPVNKIHFSRPARCLGVRRTISCSIHACDQHHLPPAAAAVDDATMDKDAPAGPGTPGQPQTSTSETGVEAVHDGADEVLLLSPDVALTLGHDALLMSCMSPFVRMDPSVIP